MLFVPGNACFEKRAIGQSGAGHRTPKELSLSSARCLRTQIPIEFVRVIFVPSSEHLEECERVFRLPTERSRRDENEEWNQGWCGRHYRPERLTRTVLRSFGGRSSAMRTKTGVKSGAGVRMDDNGLG